MTMSNKKIVVPEGILKAAYETAWGESPKDTIVQTFKVALEAALCWLSEHPIVPTYEQIVSMVRGKEGFPFESYDWVRWGASEWQRRMFAAPDPPAELYFDTPFGRFVIDSRLPPGEIRLHDWKGPTLIRSINTETEVPGQIRDIHAWCDVYFGDNPELQNLKDNVLKAYLRGQLNPK